MRGNRFDSIRVLKTGQTSQYSATLLITGEPRHALEIAKRGIRQADQRGEQGNRAWSLLSAGGAAFELGERSEAKEFFLSAKKLAENSGMLPILERCIIHV